MNLKRKSGILVHPTSFPSRYGIGDLGSSAYKFVDFLHKSNQKLWQILPLNPTSFGDSPYQSFSTFAGNHMLISPDILVEQGYLEKSDIQSIPNFDLSKVEYGNVISYKNNLFRTAFKNFKKSATDAQKESFNIFCKENSYWLNDYSLFVSLKQYFIEQRKNTFESSEYKEYFKKNSKFMDKNAINDCFYGAVWNSWPDDIAKRYKNSIKKWNTTLKDYVEYEKFLQYEFYRQWQELKKYANENEIEIIGDIPIFVAMDSCDVWSNPKLFYLDNDSNPSVVAGVPPDYFSSTGQLWGNPLYNWKAHADEKYEWWIKRISEILKTVDIVRIDHFRGFESYWAVKFGEKTAINGQWEKGCGEALFHAIEKELGELPIIAEDLGILTKEVEILRDNLNLPGMKILQFAFDGSSDNHYIPHNISHSNSVIYTGTHDNDTTVGWYESSSAECKDQFRRYMNVSGDDSAWDLIRLALSSTSAYAIVPLQDVLSLGSSDRMNTPGVGSGNWQFRYTEGMLASNLAERLQYLTNLFSR